LKLPASSTALVLIFLGIIFIAFISLTNYQASLHRSAQVAKASLDKEVYFLHNLKLWETKKQHTQNNSNYSLSNTVYQLTTGFPSMDNFYKGTWEKLDSLPRRYFLHTQLRYDGFFFQRLYFIEGKKVTWSQDWYTDFPVE
jgi:hypothetical protein